MIKKRSFLNFNQVFHYNNNDSTLTKTASLSDSASEYLNKLKEQKDDDKVIVVVNGLGAGDYYGPNVNMDYFPEEALLGKQTETEAMKNPGDAKGKKLQRFKTFNNGHVFKHHNNDDPENSIGDILDTFYNNIMKRVEIITALRPNDAEDIIRKHKNGKSLPVSMGCKVPEDFCLKSGTLVDTGRGEIPIEDVKLSDRVMTHKGQYKPVEKIFEREYSSNFVKIKIGNIESNLDVTYNHDVLCVKEDQIRNCYGSAGGRNRAHSFIDGECKTCNEKAENINLEWEKSQNLSTGDYLLSPVKEPGNKNISNNLAYLMGAYLGDGCLIKERRGRDEDGGLRSMGISISQEIGTKISKKIINKARQVLGRKPSICKNKDKNEVSIRCYDRDLAVKIRKNFKEYSKGKFIHPQVFDWDEEARKNLLAGYLDSDGSFDDDKKTARWTTTNKNLSYQIQQLLWGLKLPATNSSYQSDDFGCTNMIYQMHLGAYYCNELSDYSVKVDTNNKSEKTSAIILSNYIGFPIEGINKYEDESTVYNLKVSQDESYLANNLAVHNCSICGNAAPTRAKYCKHLKNKPNEILDDGRQVYAINKQPRFFDLSFVTVPADKTAYALKVIAPDMDLSKQSEDNKREISDPDNEFAEEIKTASAKKADQDKNSDIDKEVTQEDSEVKAEEPVNHDDIESAEEDSELLSYIRTYMHDEDRNIKEGEMQWLFVSNLMGKEAAKALCDANIYFDVDSSISCNSSVAKTASIQKNKNADIVEDVISKKYPSEAMYKQSQIRMEPKRQVEPKPVPMPDFQQSAQRTEQTMQRAQNAMIMSALLGKLVSAVKSGSTKAVNKIVSRRPQILGYIAGLVGSTGLAGMSETAPQQYIGDN